MGRAGRIWLAVVLLSITLTWTITTVYPSEAAWEKHFRLEVTYVYINKGDEPIPTVTEQYNLKAFERFVSNEWQKVRIVKKSHRIVNRVKDLDGNTYVVLNLPDEIPPGGNITVSITYDIRSTTRVPPNISGEEAGDLSDIPGDLVSEYCTATGPWLVNDKEIVSLTESIVGEETNVLRIVEKLCAWIHEHIEYPEPGEEHERPLYPNETLELREGDCDDQANLLITMCRILGIPAYLQIGCVFAEWYSASYTMWSGHLSIYEEHIGWHGWAVVYIPPWGWLPVDLTYTYVSPEETELWCILGAAALSPCVIECLNIVYSDYIKAGMRQRKVVEGSDLYIEIYESMQEYFGYPHVPISSLQPIMRLALLGIAVVAAVAIFTVLRRIQVSTIVGF